MFAVAFSPVPPCKVMFPPAVTITSPEVVPEEICAFVPLTEPPVKESVPVPFAVTVTFPNVED